MARPEPRVAVITGVSRGLGRAMAAGLAAAGWRILGCGRNQSDLDRLGRELGATHDFQVVDVVQDAAVVGWAERALALAGPPDLLVNNAAVINHSAPLWAVPREEFDHLIDVNIKGIANVVRHFVPAMVARGRGVVVNFSSGWGRSTAAEVAPYCASKWAVEGLTRALARELPDGMAAVPLNPGIVDTDMLRTSFGDSAGSYETAEDWAKRAVPFLIGLGPRDNGRPATVPG